MNLRNVQVFVIVFVVAVLGRGLSQTRFVPDELLMMRHDAPVPGDITLDPAQAQACRELFQDLEGRDYAGAWSLLSEASQDLAVRDAADLWHISEGSARQRFESGDSSLLVHLFEPERQRMRGRSVAKARFWCDACGSQDTFAVGAVLTDLLPSEGYQNDVVVVYRNHRWRVGLLETFYEKRFTTYQSASGVSEPLPVRPNACVRTFFRSLGSESVATARELLSGDVDDHELDELARVCPALDGARLTTTELRSDRAVVRVGSFDVRLSRAADCWRIDWPSVPVQAVVSSCKHSRARVNSSS